MAYKPVILVVLDGVGAPQEGSSGHPFAEAHLPTFREFEQLYPFTTIRASGAAVGLPWGEEGNSEVGHLTMGAGRVLYHHLPRIITAIKDGSFFETQALTDAVAHVKKNNSAFHLIGLFSSGSVHAYRDHVYALLDFTAREEITRVFVHPFTDGRDAPPNEGADDIAALSEKIKETYPHAAIGTVMGRFFSMDRNDNWDRTERAYQLLVDGTGIPFTDPAAHVRASYQKNIMDEFVEPGFHAGADGKPIGRIRDGDAVLYWDFREDSARQLTAAFVLDAFDHFTRRKLRDLFFVTMTEYDKAYPAAVVFPPVEIEWPLARVISDAKKTQLHVAESEKYAHVTYFLNGGREDAFPGEERVLVQSSPATNFKDDPEMSASEVTQAVLANLSAYDFIIVNYANGDMVGHTGDFAATITALEVLDRELSIVSKAALSSGGILLVTADHGNAEEKRYRESGEPRTKHTTNPIPFFLIADAYRRAEPRSDEEIQKKFRVTGGVLTDVAPTVLELLELEKPGDMTGISLMDTLLEDK
jgi:2,3-bisphosphoglycerate-independent phosphoglycerate mutase